METEVWNLFPENGLDRSLHLPVLLGLVIVSFFRETLGWTFAGLVVPGYLASVAVAAPVTAGVIVAESLPAYWLALLVGKWLPKTGAWSTFFGRERFLLLIVTSLLARLLMEGVFLPRVVHRVPGQHSRELYSLGLVLVPLLANSYWNAGFRRSFGRVMFAAAVTWFVVDTILIEHTNFSVARFQMANESVSLAFLETPHAHIILLTGAVLGAVNNVRYGWDYNGILVPALLAVAWYQPTKLLTTMVEAVVVYSASVGVTKLPPFSGWLIVGSRRLLVAFVVGFCIKLVAGYAGNRFSPELQMVDYFGFGYLLPTLLATKMWNTGRVAVTTMATLQVSLMAFVLGNALSFGLNWLDSPPSGAATGDSVSHTLASYPPEIQLMLVDSAPRPRAPDLEVGKLTPSQHVLRIMSQLRVGTPSDEVLERARAAGVTVSSPDERGWRVVGPLAQNPNRDQSTPRLAIRAQGRSLLVVESPSPASPLLASVMVLGSTFDARAIMASRTTPEQRPHDEAFARELIDLLDVESILRVSQSEGVTRLHVVGRLPRYLDLAKLSEKTGEEIDISWEAQNGYDSPLRAAPHLELSRRATARVFADRFPPPPIERWVANLPQALEKRIDDLTHVEPGRFRRRTIEELRLFSRLVARPHLRRAAEQSASAVERSFASMFGYRLAQVGPHPSAWVLFEPPGPNRRGNPTWAVTRDSRVLIEVPAPRWEVGSTTTALRLQVAVEQASVLFNGATPDAAADGSADVRHAQGLHSLYQRIHELTSNAGQPSISIHGVAPDRATTAPAYVSFRTNLADLSEAPPWSKPVLDALRANGIQPHLAGVDFETSAFLGVADPQMEYSREFSDTSMMLLWLTHPVRLQLLRAANDPHLLERLAHLESSPEVLSPQSWVETVRACAKAESCLSKKDCVANDLCSQNRTRQCSWHTVLPALRHFFEETNPYMLDRALDASEGCGLFVLQDPSTELVWAAFGTSVDEEELGNAGLMTAEGLSPPGLLFLPLQGAPTWQLGLVQSEESMRPAFSLGLRPLLVEAY